MNGGTLPTAA
jgi:hypothetical protein